MMLSCTAGSRPSPLTSASSPAPSPAASTAHLHTRRYLLGLAAAGGYALVQQLQLEPAAAEQPADLGARALSPYQRGLPGQLQYGLESGRLRSCPMDANPNCLSTTARNDGYLPAWEAPQGSPADVMAEFEAALLAVAPEARLIDSATTQSGAEYRRWQVSDSLFDHDDIEVLISPQPGPGGAPEEGPLVAIRSMAANVRYIWPVTQPITDFGSQRKRLKAVRARLGWRLRGCDLLECFQE